MPSKTRKQQRFFQAELSRKRAGKKTKTGLSVEKLQHFAGSVSKDGNFFENAKTKEAMIPMVRMKGQLDGMDHPKAGSTMSHNMAGDVKPGMKMKGQMGSDSNGMEMVMRSMSKMRKRLKGQTE